jgi:beta-phosphoglucomutase-like phosphatase (HAD superfamily)
MEDKEIVYRKMCLDLGQEFQLSPGATELLDFLVEGNIPHTIATASGRPNVDFFIENLALATWFEVDQIVHDDGTMSGKPAPDLYLRAARYLGLEPLKCVVIEDSRSGIQAARAAGIGHIIALGPVETHAELAAIEGVAEVVENLAQIRRNDLF